VDVTRVLFLEKQALRERVEQEGDGPFTRRFYAPDGWESTRTELGGLCDDASRQRCRLLVVLHPRQKQIAIPDSPDLSVLMTIKAYCEARGCPVLDLAPVFGSAYRGQNNSLYSGADHLSLSGAELAAETISTSLTRLGWLAVPRPPA
jgi:hypothetical protein